MEKKSHSLLYVFPEQKPGWRFTARRSRNAVPASWPRFDRACERKIYKKMYAVDWNFNVELFVNYYKVASYLIRASIAAI